MFCYKCGNTEFFYLSSKKVLLGDRTVNKQGISNMLIDPNSLEPNVVISNYQYSRCQQTTVKMDDLDTQEIVIPGIIGGQ